MATPLSTALCYINWALLIFNLLPIYPLDGGQILQSLLWFVLGRARSLMVTTVIGFVGVAGLILLAIWAHDGLVRHPVRVHPAELLGRADAGAGAGADREAAAPGRVCLPVLPAGADHRPALAVRQMPATVRHV